MIHRIALLSALTACVGEEEACENFTLRRMSLREGILIGGSATRGGPNRV